MSARRKAQNTVITRLIAASSIILLIWNTLKAPRVHKTVSRHFLQSSLVYQEEAMVIDSDVQFAIPSPMCN
jgi:hypothetical protein